MEELMVKAFLTFLLGTVKNAKKKAKLRSVLLKVRDFITGLYDEDVPDSEVFAKAKSDVAGMKA